MKRILSLIALMVWTACLFAQDVQVKGKIVSKTDGQPIPGVSVSVKGTTTGTITNIDGEYTLSAPQGATLVYSFIGMKTQEVVATSGTMDVAMTDEVSDLNEVVVVGYGVQKKSLVTGAIAKVSGEELKKSSDMRVTQALQGKTAGVVVAANSGQPGDQVSIRVRGTGTNGDAEPLYVVDGLPMSKEGVDFLNSADVESIEVLKDAASCAIYGARGANGVVLITTKGGKKDTKMTITYDGYYGVQNAWKKLPLLNSEEYMMLVNESYVNAGKAPIYDDAYKQNHYIADTDWQDEMLYKNAPKQNHNIGMTGGGDKLTYSSSLNYFSQDGIVAKGKSNYEKFGFRLNTQSDFGLMTFGSSLNLAHITNQGIQTNGIHGTGLNQAVNMPPIIPVYNADGSYGTPSDYGIPIGEITNPIGLLDNLFDQTKTYKAIYGLDATFDFGHLAKQLKGLSFKTAFSGEYAIVSNRKYLPVYKIDKTDNNHYNEIDKASKSYDEYNNYQFSNYLTYDNKFDAHHITVIAGVEALTNLYENLSGSKKQLILQGFDYAYIDNGTLSSSMESGGRYTKHTIASTFGRLNYDLLDRYMFSATVRRDGSSRFGTENKYGTFPSFSAGWVISNEEFMSSLSEKLDMLKIRASWGQNGNENIGDFKYASVIVNDRYYYYGDSKTQINGAMPGSWSNRDLKWETSEQIDFGADYVGLSGRLKATVDYYIKNTKDWLVIAPITMTAGNDAPTINGGEVRNSGFEYDLGWNDQIGKVHYAISTNGSFNKNEVIDIRNAEKRLQGGDGGFQQSGILYAEVGQPLGVFYGLKTNGIFQTQAEVDAYVNSKGQKIQPNAQPGDFRFVDADGDGVIDQGKDRVTLGSPYPKFQGGLDLSADAYGFDFKAFFYASLGGKVWDATRRWDRFEANYRADWLDRWTGPGTSNEYPRVTVSDTNNNLQTPSDFYVQDGSYLRLKVLTLGYTLPKSVIEKIKVNRVRFYVSGENLWTVTGYKGYEPQIGGGVFDNNIDRGVYPQARTILGGLNVTF